VIAIKQREFFQIDIYEVIIVNTMLKESAADSKNAALEITDVLTVAEKVTFSSDTSLSAANDSSISESDDEQSVGLTDTSDVRDDLEIAHYRSVLSALIEKRKVYDNQLGSHDEYLYDLLADCLALSLNSQQYDAKSSLWRAINDQREAAGVTRKIQKNTRFEATIVRFVFNESLADDFDSISRSKVYDYSVALTRAINEGITSDDFASWVKTNGGIDNIRRNFKGDDESKTVSMKKSTVLRLGKHIDEATAIGSSVTIYGVYEGKGRVRVVNVACDGK